MKRISFLLAALLMMGGMVMAQGPRRGGQDMDPKTRAERMTERMAKEYSLNETQKKELLEVNMAFVQKMGERPGRMKPEMRRGRVRLPTAALVNRIGEKLLACPKRTEKRCVRR